ncbi:MAG TPA: DUF885 family protein [Rhizomicrobium sp.]|nr:DUF885 family protein [Rhizomicrobium sp.]
MPSQRKATQQTDEHEPVFLCFAIATIALVSMCAYLIWGPPFTFRMLIERQAAITILQEPEVLRQTGLLPGLPTELYGAQFGDFSTAIRDARFAEFTRFKSELLKWDRAKLSVDDQLSYDSLLWSYDRKLDDERYPWLGADEDLYPINPVFGIQKYLFEKLTLNQTIRDEQSLRFYVESIEAAASLLNSVNLDIARQAKLGVVPPDFIIEGSISQMTAMIEKPATDNDLVAKIQVEATNAGIDYEVRRKFTNRAVAAVRNKFYPASRNLISTESALLAAARHEAGVWRFKDGEAYYRDQLRYFTSTNMTPDQVHDYGIGEVIRLTDQLDTAFKEIGRGGGSVVSRLMALTDNGNQQAAASGLSGDHLLNRYRTYLGRADVLVTQYFETAPRIPLVLRAVPQLSDMDSPAASYTAPSLDARRAGFLTLSLQSFREKPVWQEATIAYHEGIPGHHLEAALVAQTPNIPLARRLLIIPAYDEGWALYAEYLAQDMGLYKGDPRGNIGRLREELFRAARLVTDTGLHAKRWSREQAIQYLKVTAGLTQADAQAEVDRETVLPGQACAYSIGMKTILDLRNEAQAHLKSHFDIKGFHEQILGSGQLPLWLLQRKVWAWIETTGKNLHRPSSAGRDSLSRHRI